MIQLLYGDNEFARAEVLTGLRRDYIEQHGQESVASYEGSELALSDLPQLLQGQSLFADQKLIIIRDACANKTLWEGLSDTLEAMQDVELILVESKPDKRTRTFKWLQAHGEVREFQPLGESQMAEWCRARARQYDIDLSHDLAVFLVARAGTDQWLQDTNLQKLALLGKPLTLDDIMALIEPHPSASVFELLDAILSGRTKQALQTLQTVRSIEDPYKFMGLYASQLYTLALCVHAAGRSAQDIAGESGQHPYVVKKTLALARAVTPEQIKTLVAAASQCDLRLKSTGGNPWLIIETMIGAAKE